MSKREWKPGDVGVTDAKYPNETATRFIVTDAGPLLAFAYEDGDRLTVPPRAGARPLVTLDPEDREAVERLAVVLHSAEVGEGKAAPWESQYPSWRSDRIDAMQAALREFANPQEPRPEEPTGLGAVVEDASGRKWVNVFERGMWQTSDDRNEWRSDWDDVPAVRVLSPGVEVDL